MTSVGNMNKGTITPPTWGVCCVALLRESHPWWRDWIEHHVRAGASKIVVYDNTGSVGSLNPQSIYRRGTLQRNGISKRGERYGELTSHWSDSQIRQEMEALAAEYGGLVEIVDWFPRHPETRGIIHGQVEAYVDFIRRRRATLDWGLFIDADEYVYCAPEFGVRFLLADCEKRFPNVSLIQLNQIPFEMRWGTTAPKRINDLLARRLPVPSGKGMKMFARLCDVTDAGIHYEWRVKNGRSHVMASSDQFAFRHHSVDPKHDLPWLEMDHDPRAFLKQEPSCDLPPVRWKSVNHPSLTAVSLPID